MGLEIVKGETYLLASLASTHPSIVGFFPISEGNWRADFLPEFAHLSQRHHGVECYAMEVDDDDTQIVSEGHANFKLYRDGLEIGGARSIEGLRGLFERAGPVRESSSSS